MGTGARHGPRGTRTRHRGLRLRPAAGSAGVQAQGRRRRVLAAGIDGARRPGRGRASSPSIRSSSRSARSCTCPATGPGSPPTSATRSRVASSTSGSRRRPRPASGAGGPSRSPSTARSRPPPSAGSGTQSSVNRARALVLAAVRRRSLRCRPRRDTAATPSHGRRARTGSPRPGNRARPNRGDRGRREHGRDALRAQQRRRHCSPPRWRSSPSRTPRSTSSVRASGSGPSSSASASRSGRVWHGNLGLVGYGDPTLTRADLERLARRFADTGIRRVAGSRLRRRHVLRRASRRARAGSPRTSGSSRGRCRRSRSPDVPFAGLNGSAAAAARAFDGGARGAAASP